MLDRVQSHIELVTKIVRHSELLAVCGNPTYVAFAKWQPCDMRI